MQQASPHPATEKDQSIITYNKSRGEIRAGANKKASDHAGRPAGDCTKKERIQKRSRNMVVIVGYVARRWRRQILQAVESGAPAASGEADAAVATGSEDE